MANLTQDFKLRRRTPMSGRALRQPISDNVRARIEAAEAGLADTFKGITADGTVETGLFSLRETGASTETIRDAANDFIESLGPDGQANSIFPIDSDAWRRWSNIHPFLMRHGAVLEDMNANQTNLALGLLEASLSPEGYKTSRDIMRLNESIREITGSDDEYGEWLYWMSILGTPSATEPWGWQIDGHHLIINCFVLGDQVVMTPTFMGSEPVFVETGKYAGTRVFQSEESAGIALASTMDGKQRSKMVVSEDMPGEVFTSAFRDNFEMKYEGIKYDELTSQQQKLSLDIVGAYVNRAESGHAQIKMSEVKEHLSDTYIAWMGGTDEDSVFYYRIHSPVILIEFDHQAGIALDYDEPIRQHIHTVVRTPNGNDYGKDLLRQHREQVVHAHD